MSPVSFVQSGEWVLALRSVPASSETPLGSKDVADGPRVPSVSCFLMAGWAEGHSSEALLCLRRTPFPSFHNDRTYLSSLYPPSAVVLPPHRLPRLDLGALGLGAGIVLRLLPRHPRFRNTARWLSSPHSAASALLFLGSAVTLLPGLSVIPAPPPPATRWRRCPRSAGCRLCAASVSWLNSVRGGVVAGHGWLPRVCVPSLFGPSLSLEQLFFKCPFYFLPSFLTMHLLKLTYSTLTLSTCRVSQARSWGLGTQR